MRSLLLLLLSVLYVLPTSAQETPLARYIEAGLAGNLALHAQELDLARGLLALDEARYRFRPSLDLQARYSRAEGGRTIEFPVGDLLNPVYRTLNEALVAQGEPPAFPTIGNETVDFLRSREQDTRLRVTQSLFQPTLRHLVRLQRQQVAVQEAGVAAYRHTLVRDIKVAYFTYLKATQAVAIYEATSALVGEAVRVNERLFQASAQTRDAVYRAQAEVEAVAQQRAEAVRDQARARSYFNFLLNRPLEAPVEAMDLLGEVSPQAALRLISAPGAAMPSLDEVQARALDQRVELQQATAAVAAAQAATALAQSAYLPDATLVFDAGIQGADYGFSGGRSFYMGSVVLRWNLFNGFQDRNRIQQRRLEAERLATERDVLAQQIQLQVQDAYDAVRVAYEQAVPAAEAQVRAARDGFRLVARKYEEGLAPQVAFIDARTTLTRAQLNLNITRAELLIRMAELDHAIGLARTP